MKKKHSSLELLEEAEVWLHDRIHDCYDEFHDGLDTPDHVSVLEELLRLCQEKIKELKSKVRGDRE